MIRGLGGRTDEERRRERGVIESGEEQTLITVFKSVMGNDRMEMGPAGTGLGGTASSGSREMEVGD